MAVEFSDDAPIAPARPRASRDSLISRLIMKTGVIKSPQQAQMVVLVAAFLLLVVAAILFAQSSKEPVAPTPEQTVI